MINKFKETRELLAFQIFYNQKKIISTWILAFIIIAIFLVEEYYGGSTNIYVLISLGANVRNLVAEGEYARIMSSVFLHAGLLHVFFNTYVLYALGSFFNRILGDAKYLTIFFISGITGSLASLAVGKSSVSVGASGAIWGLFGASLALSIFRNNFIPETIRLNLRRMTLINLVINIGVSFLPMVDFWAHIGGGVGGFLCALVILIPLNYHIEVIRDRIFQLSALILSILYLLSIVSIWQRL